MPSALSYRGNINGEWCEVDDFSRSNTSTKKAEAGAIVQPCTPADSFSAFELKTRTKPETDAAKAACHGVEHMAYMVAVEHHRNIEKQKNETCEYVLSFSEGPLGMTIKGSFEGDHVFVVVDNVLSDGQAAKHKNKVKIGERLVDCGGVSLRLRPLGETWPAIARLPAAWLRPRSSECSHAPDASRRSTQNRVLQ